MGEPTRRYRVGAQEDMMISVSPVIMEFQDRNEDYSWRGQKDLDCVSCGKWKQDVVMLRDGVDFSTEAVFPS